MKQLVFVIFFSILLVLVIFYSRSEEFRMSSARTLARRAMTPQRTFTRRTVTSRVWGPRGLPVYQRTTTQTPPSRQMVSTQTRRGFPLGPAVGNPYQTGVVRGSAIAPLQLAYRKIFTPRPLGMVSGQVQRQQHLAPGGLGLMGWYGRGGRP